MLGLILVYFIGKWFYDLAGKHNRNKWGFAIAGLASYYGGIMIGGMIIGIIYEVIAPGRLETMNEMAVGLMALPVGVLTCWGFHRVLQHNWSNKADPKMNDVLDGDLMK